METLHMQQDVYLDVCQQLEILEEMVDEEDEMEM
jgi:hypothetical protein